MKHWERAERKHAKASGQRLVSRSGAGFQKGDTQGGDRMSEVKSSSRVNKDGDPIIVVQTAWFTTIQQHARSSGKEASVVLVVGPALERFVYTDMGEAELHQLPPEYVQMIGQSRTCTVHELRTIRGFIVGGGVWEREN